MNTNEPLTPSEEASSISVVIPLWNQPEYIFRALASVCWQLGPFDEVIVVDDASTRRVEKERVNAFPGKVAWMENPQNRGVSHTRNRAILQARGEWIKFLDADDVLAPFALNAVRHPLEPISRGTQVIHGGFHRIFDQQYGDYLNSGDEYLRGISKSNPMLPSAVFVRRRALLAVGLFDEGIDFEEDWDLWFRLLEQYGDAAFQKIVQPVCYYWIEEQERRKKPRIARRGDLTVREYFRERYGANPEPYCKETDDGPPL